MSSLNPGTPSGRGRLTCSFIALVLAACGYPSAISASQEQSMQPWTDWYAGHFSA